MQEETKDLVQRIVQENSVSPSWRQKLEIAANIADQFKSQDWFKSEGLAAISAFLYFISSGHIHCGEQGHFRPNHHAGIAYRLHK